MDINLFENQPLEKAFESLSRNSSRQVIKEVLDKLHEQLKELDKQLEKKLDEKKEEAVKLKQKIQEVLDRIRANDPKEARLILNQIISSAAFDQLDIISQIRIYQILKMLEREERARRLDAFEELI